MTTLSPSAIVIAYALQHVGSPYVYGATGQTCTPAMRRSKIKQYPAYSATIIKYCPVLSERSSNCNACKYKGRKAFDCAQLTRRALNAAELFPPSGATSQWLRFNWATKGFITKDTPTTPCFLFRQSSPSPIVMQHVGVCLGDGTVIDARSHSTGVVHRPFNTYPWTHYAIPDGYAIPQPEPSNPLPPPILFGARGPAVKSMQAQLLSLGYKLPRYGADGALGKETAAALRAFQRTYGLEPTGYGDPVSLMTLNHLRPH